MRPIDMACFVAEHDHHHIALIRQMLAAMSESGISER